MKKFFGKAAAFVAGLLFSLALAFPAFAQDRFLREFALNRTEGSLSFIWASDLHYRSKSLYNHGITPANLKALVRTAGEAEADFLALTGDLIHGNDPRPALERDLREIARILKGCSVPALVLPGNHDDGSKYAKRKGSADTLSTEEFFSLLGYAPPEGGRYYRDFPESKIRVICLNAADLPDKKDGSGMPLYPAIDNYAFRQEQLRWLAEKALRFDEEGWACLVLTHVDTEHVSPTARQKGFGHVNAVLQAFAKGEKAEIKDGEPDFEAELTADFSSQGPGELIGVFAGHVHKGGRRQKNGIQHLILGASYYNGLDYRGVVIDRKTKRIFLTDKKGKTETISYQTRKSK
ncbi:MAG: metallophosphoesterase [Abditibacteriota bacterium]|nr:metallophosphoesterase [Abditibacteriota bacterium]